MIHIKQLPPLDELHARFSYDSESGVLSYKHNGVGKIRAGAVAGKLSRGYRYISIQGQSYPAHRIAWALHYNQLPDTHLQVDHINQDRSDNRIDNLRLVCHRDNSLNRQPSPRGPNKNRNVGVTWDKERQKWKASYRSKRLGRFNTRAEAIAARVAALQADGYEV